MITFEQVKEVVLGLPSDRMNPREDRDGDLTCLYTGFDGSHCIAGEVLTRLGYKVPEYEGYYNASAIDDLIKLLDLEIEPKALSLLIGLQAGADNHTSSRNPNAWGMAIAELVRLGRLNGT